MAGRWTPAEVSVYRGVSSAGGSVPSGGSTHPPGLPLYSLREVVVVPL